MLLICSLCSKVATSVVFPASELRSPSSMSISDLAVMIPAMVCGGLKFCASKCLCLREWQRRWCLTGRGTRHCRYTHPGLQSRTVVRGVAGFRGPNHCLRPKGIAAFVWPPCQGRPWLRTSAQRPTLVDLAPRLCPRSKLGSSLSLQTEVLGLDPFTVLLVSCLSPGVKAKMAAIPMRTEEGA